MNFNNEKSLHEDKKTAGSANPTVPSINHNSNTCKLAIQENHNSHVIKFTNLNSTHTHDPVPVTDNKEYMKILDIKNLDSEIQTNATVVMQSISTFDIDGDPSIAHPTGLNLNQHDTGSQDDGNNSSNKSFTDPEISGTEATEVAAYIQESYLTFKYI